MKDERKTRTVLVFLSSFILHPSSLPESLITSL
jgi:hypothetical protein